MYITVLAESRCIVKLCMVTSYSYGLYVISTCTQCCCYCCTTLYCFEPHSSPAKTDMLCDRLQDCVSEDPGNSEYQLKLGRALWQVRENHMESCGRCYAALVKVMCLLILYVDGFFVKYTLVYSSQRCHPMLFSLVSRTSCMQCKGNLSCRIY